MKASDREMKSLAFMFFLKRKFEYLTFLAAIIYLAFAPKSFTPSCPIHKYFGIYCPGCGGVRAIRSLLHGSFSQALRDNALLCSYPLLALFGIFVVRRRSSKISLAYFTFLGLLVITFTYARNMPGSIFAPVSAI